MAEPSSRIFEGVLKRVHPSCLREGRVDWKGVGFGRGMGRVVVTGLMAR